jgi:tRNA A-37 threonylcarbamoyl transferase component Bud32/tetratricopeptide (TPR) repeat protein
MTGVVDAGARLAAGLAGRYRIDRDVGRGGMATVYLAHDLRHAREVAIKVLRPELAAALGAERFLREIRLAARLQHPHVLTVLDSGDADGLLWFAMPFVHGESLRARLARDGRLPLSDAVSIAREVADALTAAHEAGIVHRDIKPENILLSHGHAMVADFGIAKASSPEPDERAHALTAAGMAMGTPHYMSPEQATGDRAVDARTDVYALGVMLYEMLAGAPPFRGESLQAVLVRTLTGTARPLHELRPDTPALLDTIVARAMARDPDARFQSAGELRRLLEAVGAGSGETTAAIKRGHPARVTVVFAAAAVVILAVVAFLTYRLGLPDWVLWGAGSLLLVGLPVAVITGLHERRRAGAIPASLTTETVTSRFFTWRRASAAAGVAFALLALATIVYSAMRAFGIGPVGTLLASGALEHRDQLVLSEFENRTSDSTLGGSVTEALRVDLSQSRSVRLVDAVEVAQALARMQRPPGTPLTADVAREMGDRIGAKAIVAGQIDPVGGGFLLSANLVAARDGRVLTAVRETARSPDALLEAIDQLSAKLRERIGESLVTIRANPPLEQVSTASLPALRKYSEGVRLLDQRRLEEAVSLLEQAIALDSNFAMAWRKLAVALANAFASDARQDAAATKAFQLRDRLPDVERELAAAYYYGTVENDPAKEAAAYRALLAFDPENHAALNNLAGNYSMARRYAEAETLAVRGLVVSNNEATYTMVLVAQVAQGRMEAARRTMQEFERRAPPNAPSRLRFRAFLALAAGQRDSAARLIERLQQEQRASPEWQARTSSALAAIAEMEGRLGDAERHLRAYMAASDARGLSRDYVRAAAELARIEVQYRNRPDSALALIRQAQSRHPMDSVPVADRPYLELADGYAMAGRPAEARRVLRDYEATVPASVRRGDDLRPRSYGRVAEAEGRLAAAAASYAEHYAAFGICGICGLYELARTEDRLGQTDSARVHYERLVATPTIVGHLVATPAGLAASYKRLGELHEAAGNRARARENYQKFMDLWTNADPELQPAVKDTRERLARLAQEPGA